MAGGQAWQGRVCVAWGHVWQGVCMAEGEGACMPGGGMHGRGACVAGEMATAVGSMHPTGMHSCCLLLWMNSQQGIIRLIVHYSIQDFILVMADPGSRRWGGGSVNPRGCALNYYYHPQTKFVKVMFPQVFVCPLSTGGGRSRSLSRGVHDQGVSVQGDSLSRGSLSRGYLSRDSLSRGSLSKGFSVQGGSLSRGSLPRGSLSRGVLCPGGSLSRGSLSKCSLSKGFSVQGVSVCRGLCLGVSVRDPPPYGNKQAVRILCDCILV